MGFYAGVMTWFVAFGLMMMLISGALLPKAHMVKRGRVRKMCPMTRSNCGRCENCKMDWWSEVWRSLDDEMQGWVVA